MDVENRQEFRTALKRVPPIVWSVARLDDIPVQIDLPLY